MDEKASLGNGCKSKSITTTTQPRYSGIRNVLQSVYTEGGMRGLYRGVGTLLCIILYHISYICIFLIGY